MKGLAITVSYKHIVSEEVLKEIYKRYLAWEEEINGGRYCDVSFEEFVDNIDDFLFKDDLIDYLDYFKDYILGFTLPLEIEHLK